MYYQWKVEVIAGKIVALQRSEEEKEYLLHQVCMRTSQAQTVMRARILLLRAEGKTINVIADRVCLNRNSVILCHRKYKEGGLEYALVDSPSRGHNLEITDDEEAWIVDLAYQSSVDLGDAAQTWINTKLAAHFHRTIEAAGYTRLFSIATSTVHGILDQAVIKSFKIRHYCERRTPDFMQKMHNVLLVFKQISKCLHADGIVLFFEEEDEDCIYVVSYNEKPSIQAMATTSDDRQPMRGHGETMRDYEYKCLGTLSLLAGIDLYTGEAIPLVSESHTSKVYMVFLKLLDAKYPVVAKMRLVLDSIRVHASKATRAYLASVPGRFEFVFTPAYGLLLNLVEGFLSKMSRQTLRRSLVKFKDELKECIYLYFDEINEAPVICHWKYKQSYLDEMEQAKTGTLFLDEIS